MIHEAWGFPFCQIRGNAVILWQMSWRGYFIFPLSSLTDSGRETKQNRFSLMFESQCSSLSMLSLTFSPIVFAALSRFLCFSFRIQSGHAHCWQPQEGQVAHPDPADHLQHAALLSRAVGSPHHLRGNDLSLPQPLASAQQQPQAVTEQRLGQPGLQVHHASLLSPEQQTTRWVLVFSVTSLGSLSHQLFVTNWICENSQETCPGEKYFHYFD